MAGSAVALVFDAGQHVLAGEIKVGNKARGRRNVAHAIGFVSKEATRVHVGGIARTEFGAAARRSRSRCKWSGMKEDWAVGNQGGDRRLDLTDRSALQSGRCNKLRRGDQGCTRALVDDSGRRQRNVGVTRAGI